MTIFPNLQTPHSSSGSPKTSVKSTPRVLPRSVSAISQLFKVSKASNLAVLPQNTSERSLLESLSESSTVSMDTEKPPYSSPPTSLISDLNKDISLLRKSLKTMFRSTKKNEDLAAFLEDYSLLSHTFNTNCDGFKRESGFKRLISAATRLVLGYSKSLRLTLFSGNQITYREVSGTAKVHLEKKQSSSLRANFETPDTLIKLAEASEVMAYEEPLKRGPNLGVPLYPLDYMAAFSQVQKDSTVRKLLSAGLLRAIWDEMDKFQVFSPPEIVEMKEVNGSVLRMEDFNEAASHVSQRGLSGERMNDNEEQKNYLEERDENEEEEEEEEGLYLEQISDSGSSQRTCSQGGNTSIEGSYRVLESSSKLSPVSEEVPSGLYSTPASEISALSSSSQGVFRSPLKSTHVSSFQDPLFTPFSGETSDRLPSEISSATTPIISRFTSATPSNTLFSDFPLFGFSHKPFEELISSSLVTRNFAPFSSLEMATYPSPGLLSPKKGVLKIDHEMAAKSTSSLSHTHDYTKDMDVLLREVDDYINTEMVALPEKKEENGGLFGGLGGTLEKNRGGLKKNGDFLSSLSQKKIVDARDLFKSRKEAREEGKEQNEGPQDPKNAVLGLPSRTSERKESAPKSALSEDFFPPSFLDWLEEAVSSDTEETSTKDTQKLFSIFSQEKPQTGTSKDKSGTVRDTPGDTGSSASRDINTVPVDVAFEEKQALSGRLFFSSRAEVRFFRAEACPLDIFKDEFFAATFESLETPVSPIEVSGALRSILKTPKSAEKPIWVQKMEGSPQTSPWASQAFFPPNSEHPPTIWGPSRAYSPELSLWDPFMGGEGKDEKLLQNDSGAHNAPSSCATEGPSRSAGVQSAVPVECTEEESSALKVEVNLLISEGSGLGEMLARTEEEFLLVCCSSQELESFLCGLKQHRDVAKEAIEEGLLGCTQSGFREDIRNAQKFLSEAKKFYAEVQAFTQNGLRFLGTIDPFVDRCFSIKGKLTQSGQFSRQLLQIGELIEDVTGTEQFGCLGEITENFEKGISALEYLTFAVGMFEEELAKDEREANEAKEVSGQGKPI